MSDPFSERTWKGDYPLKWCDLCYAATIVCEDCDLPSCSGGGCDQCQEAFQNFHQSNIVVEAYLTPEETQVYQKALRIKHFMLSSLERGEMTIDWKRLQRDGELSANDEIVFEAQLK
jgi:hypothetical protein